MASPLLLTIFSILYLSCTPSSMAEDPPTPTPWPHQFHSILYITYSGAISLVDLWYDWPRGRNFNIIQKQLGGHPLHDLEWDNGTSFYYTLDPSSPSCRTHHFPVGILRPDWLHGATYLGQRHADGFLCNVWEKADRFITYYEDVATSRPVHWLFHTGRAAHVMTFEVGAVLGDDKWQAPAYCFSGEEEGSSINPDLTIATESVMMQKRSLMGF